MQLLHMQSQMDPTICHAFLIGFASSTYLISNQSLKTSKVISNLTQIMSNNFVIVCVKMLNSYFRLLLLFGFYIYFGPPGLAKLAGHTPFTGPAPTLPCRFLLPQHSIYIKNNNNNSLSYLLLISL